MSQKLTEAQPTESKSRDYSDRVWTLPNILSFFRLGMIPLICFLYAVKDNGLLTAAVLVLSGLTDVVDGFIARRFNMISNFGKALDPIADKLTQAVTLVLLVGKFPYMLAVFALLLVKEVVTGAVSLYVTQKTGTVNGAVWHGKLTTVLLYLTMFLHLVWTDILPLVSYILMGVCVGVMVMSFCLYAVRNKQLLNAHKK